MFPIIEQLSDLAPFLVDRKEINVVTQPNGYHVVCYAISTPTTFTDPNPVKQSFLRECRGITFYPDGKIAGRPFHKFFNVDERESTMLYNLDMSVDNVVRVTDKRDGSMLHPIMMPDGSIALKSKKSFTSDVAIKATKFLHEEKNANILTLCSIYAAAGFTPIFEFTAPDNRIVLQYAETSLRLLQVRNNKTGEYYKPDQLKLLASTFEIDVVDEYPTESIAEVIARIPDATNIEGFVIQFKNGEMVKWKTPWYCQLHRMVVFQRRRDIAEMVLDETIDDVKSAFKDDPLRLEIIAEIETIIMADILQIEDYVETLLASVSDKTRKEIAMTHNKDRYFSLLMDLYSGKEPKYISFYKDHVLKEKFDLTQI